MLGQLTVKAQFFVSYNWTPSLRNECTFMLSIATTVNMCYEGDNIQDVHFLRLIINAGCNWLYILIMRDNYDVCTL